MKGNVLQLLFPGCVFGFYNISPNNVETEDFKCGHTLDDHKDVRTVCVVFCLVFFGCVVLYECTIVTPWKPDHTAIKTKRPVKWEKTWLDPGSLDSPPRLRQTHLFSCPFFVADTEPLAKEGFATKEHWKHTAQQQLEDHFMETNKKRKQKTFHCMCQHCFHSGDAGPHKNKCPSLCSRQMYILWATGEWTQHAVSDGPVGWRAAPALADWLWWR